MKRDNDPRQLNTYCVERFRADEAARCVCNNCGAEVYACECGASCEADGSKHECAD